MTDPRDPTLPEASALPETAAAPAAARRRPVPRRAALGAGALALLALGFAGGAAAWSATAHHEVRFDPSLAATPIAQLKDSSTVGVTGQVAEIYGNKFVLSDGAARALVETGRAGEGGKLVAAGETVTVQGRFDDGFLRADAIRHADQRIDALDPPPPPPHRHGPDRDLRDTGPAERG